MYSEYMIVYIQYIWYEATHISHNFTLFINIVYIGTLFMSCMLKRLLGSKISVSPLEEREDQIIRSEAYLTLTCIPQADAFVKINKTTQNTIELNKGVFPSFFFLESF